jgi:hypothetical protein
MISRRDFTKLTAVGGGAVFVGGLAGCASYGAGGGSREAFYLVQLSDTRRGFSRLPNPDAASTLKTVAPPAMPLKWDPAEPDKGLDFCEVEVSGKAPCYALSEYPVTRA